MPVWVGWWYLVSSRSQEHITHIHCCAAFTVSVTEQQRLALLGRDELEAKCKLIHSLVMGTNTLNLCLSSYITHSVTDIEEYFHIIAHSCTDYANAC